VSDTSSDETLLLKFRNGDADAFSELYARHKDAVYRYFLRQVQIPASAEELAQDVWTNIIYSVETYSELAKFTTYLYRIARNRLIDAVRRQKIRPVDAGTVQQESEIADTAEQQPEQMLEKQQQLMKIKQLVTQLPDQQRDAFLLKEECGLGISDISLICHCNEETIKSRLRYAYARLREGMKKFNGVADNSDSERRRNIDSRRLSNDMPLRSISDEDLANPDS